MKPDDDESALCPCGSGWFELRPTDGTGLAVGLVCLNNTGTITGHAGAFFCGVCGEPWAPRRQRLRVV